MRAPSLWTSVVVCGALILGACGPERPNFDTRPTDAATDTASPPTDARGCTRQEDCNDNVACTEDACVFGGVCEHIVNDRLCMSGQRCFANRGCASGMTCTSNADCDDRVACTRDTCAVGGVCSNRRDDSQCAATETCSTTLGCVMAGRCAGDIDCDNGLYCDGMERCVSGMCQPGTRPDCADTDMCTADLCNEAMRMCTHTPLDPCGGSFMPGTYDITPSATYSCGAGAFGPVVSLAVSGGTSGVRVTGFPVELTGPAPSGGMFTASGSWSQGGCTWRFGFNGAFIGTGRLEGSWNLSFDFCSAGLGCFSQSGSIAGTRR